MSHDKNMASAWKKAMKPPCCNLQLTQYYVSFLNKYKEWGRARDEGSTHNRERLRKRESMHIRKPEMRSKINPEVSCTGLKKKKLKDHKYFTFVIKHFTDL